MIITLSWLKDHLNTKLNLDQIVEKLTNIGLEVEAVKSNSGSKDEFKIGKIVKVTKHPNADKLKLCDVNLGTTEVIKVVCGANNARDGLITVYAPPGAVIPKTKMKLKIAKIRGVESHGMLCSENELEISSESSGIIELKGKEKKIGQNFFDSKGEKIIDISVTPNRPDCLGVRGIARDLAATGVGRLIDLKKIKLKQNFSQSIKVSVLKESNSGCLAFGSCLIKNIKNKESPKWLKEKIISLGLKPISAVVDITNYVMFDLNRPMHAYDAEKINKEIIVRNSKNGEIFKGLDDKQYKLEKDMCVISDKTGVLGLGGIIGGSRSGTTLNTKTILLEAAHFSPSSIRKTAKNLNIETDAKYRFERGVDPNSIEEGLKIATDLIIDICGGVSSKFNLTGKMKLKKKEIELDLLRFKDVIGFNISPSEIKKILISLGFIVKAGKKKFKVAIPSWRPDVSQEIDLIEELVRIKGFDKISIIEPKKIRTQETLNFNQKIFHISQRTVSNAGYLEAVTWSFTDSKIDSMLSPGENLISIHNPISSDLDVLRRSIFSNLLIYLKKNQDRGYQDTSLFEVGPIFYGKNPGEQQTIVGGLRSGKFIKKNWSEKTRPVDVFDVKADVIKTLSEYGIQENNMYVTNKSKSSYHPGRSGSFYLNSEKGHPLAYFGEIHPNITSKLDFKEKNIYGFEIFLDKIPQPVDKLRFLRDNFKTSEFQKSERDFAFVIDKDYQVGSLKNIIIEIDPLIIKSVRIFDVFEGENLPKEKKSVAINVSIQSDNKTLSEDDLNLISERIIKKVQNQTGGSIRS
tara:strand:+ start:1919 stop:4321 length:2403 start_codon:yes stop_codon:yes gene_type:complete